MYRPAAPILKTITRDPITFRTRDIKPGEQVNSIWDEVLRGQSRMINTEGKTLESQLAEDLHESKFYNEADAVEDAVLFPEEISKGELNALSKVSLFKGLTNPVHDLGKEGPDMHRFIEDLDTDEETESIDSSSEEDEGHLTEDKSHDTESDELPLGKNGSNENLPGGQVAKLPDFMSLNIFTNQEKRNMAVLDKWESPLQKRYDVAREFDKFLDREKSKGKAFRFQSTIQANRSQLAFKQSWHNADLEPGGPERYREAQKLLMQMEKSNTSKNIFDYIPPLQFVGIHPDRNRRVVPDMRQARAMTTLFFPSEFLESKFGRKYKNSLLLNQVERAQKPITRRSHTSNKYRPKEFWTEWDTFQKQKRAQEDFP
ncbi:hypothetical protein MMC28_007937 [Mycoblastus sanguinarius]|nr:hypothetical protein [Mycoblastus sanguinarius]